MTIHILGDPAGWYVRELCQAAEALGQSTTVVAGVGLRARVGPGSSVGFHVPEACQAENTRPPELLLVRSMPIGTLEQVIFRMNALHQLEASGTSIFNSPHSLELAIDKYLTAARFATANLPVPTSYCSQTAECAMQDFQSLNHDSVVKPVFGGEGRGIFRVSDPDLAWRSFKALERCGSLIFQQQFVDHENRDLRVLFIGELAYAIERHNPTDWRANTSRGSTARAIELDDELMALARQAKTISGAEIVGVDLVVDRQTGKAFLLEVNSVPGWRGVSKSYGVDIARQVIQFCLQQAEKLT